MSDNEFTDAFDVFSKLSDADKKAIDADLDLAATGVNLLDGLTPVRPAAQAFHDAWEETKDLANGRSITDLAAQGEDRLLNGDPREVWDQIKPENTPVSDDTGEAALRVVQGATDVLAATTPGGSFHGAM